ncbi:MULTISPECIES: hypothetical protein [unclassified Paraburkholderia]|uniref:hypothetical protein n=1 Tax=unclassified Paraburkholderia TaxID=2615204 RepID=UPI002AB13F06|nr:MULTISPECIES: hypothetical protein [unclassified Paraburkholderia]
MNLQDQIGAIDAGVDQLIQAASAAHAPAAAVAATPETTASTAAAAIAPAEPEARAEVPAEAPVAAELVPPPELPELFELPELPEAPALPASSATRPTLEVGRPAQNEITMTIGGQTVSLHPMQVSQLIEELANVRASMQPEPPPEIPPGWRFASTKNPMMAVQKQSNGDRLLVMRHTGHGWVPFTFSPDMVVQMYMMLTQR